jgi:hypothetical protein
MISIFIQFRFVAFHKWPDAPERYAYLGNLHRHEFHVRAVMEVSHENRAVEFIELKENIRTATIEKRYDIATECWSCETWAKHILNLRKDFIEVTVSEDGENGAIVTR